MIQYISHVAKKLILVLWIGVLILGIYTFIFHREYITAEYIARFLRSFGPLLFVVYFSLSMLRGFTLVPSMPFVVAGVILFPMELQFVYIISLIGILFSSSMVYFFSREMGFDKVIMDHKSYKKTHNLLEKYGFPFVLFWSFFPLVPTDLICYAAGVLRMNYLKFIGAVAIGEGIICIPIVFGLGEMTDIFIRFFS